MHRCLTSLLAACVLALAHEAAAATLPSGFTVESVTPGQSFDTPTAMAFLPDGRLLVAEKRGRVYIVDAGVKIPQPAWFREDEVMNEGDRGLLGIAVDPDFSLNRRVYLLYTVDPDSNEVDDGNGFGRIARYQMTTGPLPILDPATRTILMGVDWRHGALSDFGSHTIGSLRFGPDRSLLVSIGDGASYNGVDAGGLDTSAFGAGKTDPNEDIGAFRAQDLNSLCGKVLRINPVNGHGYASNPFATGDLTAVRSRVLAYGCRNPFRICIRPGTGSTDPAAGNPGTVYVGDVGWTVWEEMSVVKTGQRNMGWPCYEGPVPLSDYQEADPDHHDCSTIGSPENPAPAFLPEISWNHYTPSASIPPGYLGNAASGACFYAALSYPVPYRGALFYTDYGHDWIRYAVFDASDQLVSVTEFATDTEDPVDLVADPQTGDLHYVSIGAGEVRRIRYPSGSPDGVAPVAVAEGGPRVGLAPMTVSFNGAGSFDPDGDPITYLWTFGDGEASSLASPEHTYQVAGVHTAVLAVTDTSGKIGRDSLIVVVQSTGGFPTTPVGDNFNRPNGPPGFRWSDAANLVIDGGELVPTGYASAVWTGATPGPDQEAYVTIEVVSPAAPEHNLMLKVQGIHWYNGHIEVSYDAPQSRVAVAAYIPSVGWTMHGFLTELSFANGDQFGARAYANGIVQVFKNGLLAGTVDVSAWPFHALGGRIGLTLSTPVGARLDDFGGGNYVVNAPPTAAILAPADSSFFAAGDSIALAGAADDAESSPAELQHVWWVDIHHNNHVHPGAPLAVTPEAVYVGQDHDDGTGVFFEAVFSVTDEGGLSDTARVRLFPEVDLEPTSVTVTPKPPGTTTNAEYRFWIRNHGAMPAPVSRWALTADGYLLAEGDTLVAARDSVEIVMDVGPVMPAGSYTARVRVDSLAKVVETEEGNNVSVASLTVVGGGTVDVGTGPPKILALAAPRPNPTQGEVRLELGLPMRERVRFAVFDVQGREVWRAAERVYEPGWWSLVWNGMDRDRRRVSPGLYLARVEVGSRSLVRPVVVIH